MDNILIVKECFDEIEILVQYLTSKNFSIEILTKDDLSKTKTSRSILICNKKFEETVGGKSILVKMARNLGSNKLITLCSELNENFSIENEMGGSFVKINYSKLDDVVKEIIFQQIASQKYSFSDPKTISLIKMAEKVAKTDVTVFIHGPTGTGKEVVSNYIHQKSNRSKIHS